MRATLVAAMILLTASLVVAQQPTQQQPTYTPGKSHEAGMQTGVRNTPQILQSFPDTAEAKRLTDLLSKNNVTLADAIKNAEKHCNGKAVAANICLGGTMTGARHDEPTGMRRDEPTGARRDEPTGMRRDEPTGATGDQVVIHVCCLNDRGESVVVTVDGRNGEVRQAQPLAMLKTGTMHGGAGAMAMGTPRVRSADEIMGNKVVNAQNTDVGDIKDVAIAENGRIAYAVLSFGGFLGMGDDLFAVPWPALQVRTDDRVVFHGATKEELENASGFDEQRWPLTADRRWLRGEYQLAGYEEGGQMPTFRFKATDLIGKKIKNTQGEDLGTCSDLGVDSNSGRIAFCVLSHGGILGIGDKLIAIPWSAIDATNRDVLQVNITKDRLNSAPNFTKDAWNTTVADSNWVANAYRYFNQEPYWTGTGTRQPRGTEREEGRRTP